MSHLASTSDHGSAVGWMSTSAPCSARARAISGKMMSVQVRVARTPISVSTTGNMLRLPYFSVYSV